MKKAPLILRGIEYAKQRLGLRTYHFELSVAFLFLSAVAAYSGKGSIEWIGVLAVFFSFAHTSVADRLAEAQAKEAATASQVRVACYYKLERYFYAKEICWCIYFYLLGAWSALAGVGLFLVYPLWRRLWRRYYPL
jgi:hypothetical protein